MVAGLAAAMLIVTGCAPIPRGDAPLDSFEKELDAQPPTSASLPEEVAAALISAAPQDEAIDDELAEPRFDVAAESVPAREFLMGLVEGTPYNMVVHPAVSGDVSLELKAVTIPEVMDILRDVYGFYYQRTRIGFQVLPGLMQTQVFYVNYLNLVRKGTSQTQVSSGQVSEANTRDDYDRNTSRSRSSQTGRNSKNKTVSGSRIETESNADFWNEMSRALNTMIGQEEGRHVIVQPQAGVVVIRALPNELQAVERYLATIQGNLMRQVILEAKILEVALGDGYQAGINWTLMMNDVTLALSRGDIFADNGLSKIIGSEGDGVFSGLPSGEFGGVFSATMDFSDFQAFIELLETQGDVQVLSSPRIATVNNQKAVIKVGSDEFFVTDVSSTTVTGTATTTSPDITLTPFFSGIALDVTPQIDPQGRVTLHVHPTVSEVTDQTKDITVGGQTQSLPLAFSTVRESDSIVSAESGQIVVIGGLMKSIQQKRDAGVPLLGRLPAIGSLFRQTQSISRKSELVILLRPLVVGSDSWEVALNDSRQRFRQLGNNLDTEWRGGKFARPAR
jgi:MSHA biogenesis protein MshL